VSDYQQNFNARLYWPGRMARFSRVFPERVRMWSPWWLRHVVAVERTLHERTLQKLRREAVRSADGFVSAFYDPEAKALYIRLREARDGIRTVSLDGSDSVMLDRDSRGVVGVEALLSGPLAVLSGNADETRTRSAIPWTFATEKRDR
jgi:uncharacterized protein YuzE